VADVWSQKLGNSVESVLFVGAQGGIEEKLVPRSGYVLKVLKVGSLNRVSLARKLKTCYQLPLSLIRSGIILCQFKPDFVLGVGGYSSGPLVLMAWLLRALHLIRPRIAILEQNSVPGFTNRILGRFVDFVFAAFPGTEKQFPGRQVVLTGNPIRSSMKPMASASRNPFTVFVFGGSQGAIGINTLILNALSHIDPSLKNRLKWIHQTGEKDYERVREGYLKAGIPEIQWRVEKFIYEMPAVYAESSLLICRAGSSTLAEVAAVGRAAILIPLPTAADNHQERNARVFTDQGAASLILQQNTTGKDLARLVSDFVQAPGRISQMEKAVVQYFRPKAAEDIVGALTTLSVL
jgi:UDP-N-acetylglucosamine--N-acetylmuramyl-(pentapeptide) pyrophosphoryl-undecaprenol N-acetylglucosamine transferase